MFIVCIIHLEIINILSTLRSNPHLSFSHAREIKKNTQKTPKMVQGLRLYTDVNLCKKMVHLKDASGPVYGRRLTTSYDEKT